MTAVTMWCNKIVSNEVRQINTTGAILQKGKKGSTLWPTQQINAGTAKGERLYTKRTTVPC